MNGVPLRRRDVLLGPAMLAATGAVAGRAGAVGTARPRVVHALYDGAVEANLRESFLHRVVAMPLEWLGLVPRYHDIRQGLPDPTAPDVLGAVSCFLEPSLPDITAFATWTEELIASGRRLVVLGEIGAQPGSATEAVRDAGLQRVFGALGLRAMGAWRAVTLGDRIIHRDPQAGIGFEQAFDGGALPPFEIWEPATSDLRSWLVVERAVGRRRSHVVAVSPRGGFVAAGYLVAYHQASGLRRWRLDPFAFLDAAFSIRDQPRPDTTTLCGRRVYYSHIDGEAWQTVSQIRTVGGARATNAEIIHQRVIAPNPDLPVSVAPIAIAPDSARNGDARAIATARALLALPQVEAVGLAKINGGDTRCDDDHPSITAVAPMGLPLHDGRVQVYASNSSEDTYTGYWSSRFYGFRDLPVTWSRTEAPRRLKPMNLHYQMHSGERIASLNALLSNIATLRKAPFIGVATSRFARSVEGFYRAKIHQIGPSAWRISERGGLATLRFAQAEARMLDPVASSGVLGESIANGDLYVALDPADPAPVVALMPRREEPLPRPMLSDASWEVSGLEIQGDGFAFTARGWGNGVLRWRVSRSDAWRVAAQTWRAEATATDGVLTLAVPALAVGGVRLTVRPR